MPTSRRTRTLTCALIVGLLSTASWAQFRKPEDAVAYRKGAMNVMGNHFYSRLGGMANGRVPFDAKVAVESAEAVAFMSKLPWSGFGPGTQVGDTAAKANLWTEQAKFRELADKVQAETAKLAAAAKEGKLESLQSAYRATGAVCKQCHDAFTNL